MSNAHETPANRSEWRHPVFKTKVLSVLRRLRVPMWTHHKLTPSNIHLQKVSGALTNAVFFVTFNPRHEPTSPSMSPLLTPTMPASDPDHPPFLTEADYPQTLLLRIYGPSSDQLISRDEELRILHTLSTQYGLGPKIYGTFLNGRVEQFFPSRALHAEELRVPKLSMGIARRMRELHSVDPVKLGFDHGREKQPMIWTSISQWLPAAEEMVSSLTALGGTWEMLGEEIAFHRFREELEQYRRWVTGITNTDKEVVFSHNDTQYGNLLLLDAELPRGVPDHHRLIVVDFEYASPNCRGYDIANHFHEWRANYHHPTLSHSLMPHGNYPTPEERERFYRSYLSVEMSQGEELLRDLADVDAAKVAQLEEETLRWSPASSAFWALWGLISAEEQISGIASEKETGQPYTPDWDYLSYAVERFQMFRDDARGLGAIA